MGMQRGYFALIIAQCSIGVNVIAGKVLVTQFPILLILSGRFLISTLLLYSAMSFLKTPLADPEHPDTRLQANDWFMLALQAIFAGFLFNMLFVWGLQYTSATKAGIIGSTLPAIVALSAIWLLKEKLKLRLILGLILATIGIVIINIDGFSSAGFNREVLLGDLVIFMAMFPEAWYSIISRKLANRVTPLGAALIANGITFLGMLPFGIIHWSKFMNEVNFSHLGLLFVQGISSFLFFWLWGFGLKKIPASKAAIFGGIMPCATTILAISVLDEQLHWYEIIGIVLVIGSILVCTDKAKTSQPQNNRITENRNQTTVVESSFTNN